MLKDSLKEILLNLFFLISNCLFIFAIWYRLYKDYSKLNLFIAIILNLFIIWGVIYGYMLFY